MNRTQGGFWTTKDVVVDKVIPGVTLGNYAGQVTKAYNRGTDETPNHARRASVIIPYRTRSVWSRYNFFQRARLEAW